MKGPWLSVLLGECRLCKSPVLSTQCYVCWTPAGLDLKYYKHKECAQGQKMLAKMIGNLPQDSAVADLFGAQPMSSRLQWWKRHPGMSMSDLATQLQADYHEAVQEDDMKRWKYIGVPTDEFDLKKKYGPERQDQVDAIMSRGGFFCPSRKVILYEDPTYELCREGTEVKRKTRERRAKQESSVKKPAKPKAKGKGKAKAKAKGAKLTRHFEGELDGNDGDDPTGAEPKKPKKSKKIGKALETKMMNVLSEAEEMLCNYEGEKERIEAWEGAKPDQDMIDNRILL